MLSPEMKAELASALATSALGYAKMSETDERNDQSVSYDNCSISSDKVVPIATAGPFRKRKLLAISKEDQFTGPPSSHDPYSEKSASSFFSTLSNSVNLAESIIDNPGDRARVSRKAREARLEQNRVAARKSRMRKKTTIRNFRHSISYYQSTNDAIKQENETLLKVLAKAKEFVKSSRSQNDQTYGTSEVMRSATHPKLNRFCDQVKAGIPSNNSQRCFSKTVNEVKVEKILNMQSSTRNRLLSDPAPGVINGIQPTKSDMISNCFRENCTDTSIKLNNTHPLMPLTQPETEHKIAQGLSAAATCAANLQIAAANFQAAIAASMGNPLLNFLGPSQSPGSIAANFPLIIPFLTGNSFSQHQCFTQELTSADAVPTVFNDSLPHSRSLFSKTSTIVGNTDEVFEAQNEAQKV